MVCSLDYLCSVVVGALAAVEALVLVGFAVAAGVVVGAALV